MNKKELIAKTINKKRGYVYYSGRGKYRTEYENGIVKVHHYGTRIITFSVIPEKRLKNGEYANLGSGWSNSDKDMLRICLNHVFDIHHIEYELITRKYWEKSKSSRKWFSERYRIVEDGSPWYLCLGKPPKQTTLYYHNPFREAILELIRPIDEEIEIAKKQLEGTLKKQLKYLNSFSPLKITSKGIKFQIGDRNILVSYNGNVYSGNKRICIQLLNDGREFTTLDEILAKAIGIMTKPQILNEGIQWEGRNSNLMTLQDVLMEETTKQIFEKKRNYQDLLNETLIHEPKRKRRYVRRESRYLFEQGKQRTLEGKEI